MMVCGAIEQWRSPGSPITIGPRAVHVWRIMTEADAVGEAALDRAWAKLDPVERERAERVSDWGARVRFALTRAALRTALARYFDAADADLELRYSTLGKPAATLCGEPVELGFSVSHARDLSLLAFARGRIGIDVEQVRQPRRADVIARRLFSPLVQHALAHVPAAARTEAFLHAWTQREAYIKAVGGGVFQTEDPLALTWPPAADIEVQRPAAAGDHAAWSISCFAPAPRFVATLVAEGIVDAIEYWSCE